MKTKNQFETVMNGVETSFTKQLKEPLPNNPHNPLLANLTNELLLANLKALVHGERKTTAEILEYIKEVDSRRLYLQLGHTSLFSYLTKDLGYTPASAQRRIESARLLRSVPELAGEIATGSLNLMQTSMLAQALREQNLLADVNKNIIEKIKGRDLAQTQVVLAQELNIAPKTFEKKRLQRDESLRLELTLSKEQRQLFQRVKDLLSHVKPNPTWAELFELMAKDCLKVRDPEYKRSTRKTKAATSLRGAAINEIANSPSTNSLAITASELRATATRMVALARQEGRHLTLLGSTRRPHIPADLKRHIFARDESCQWQNPHTGEICGSTFQLQLDHIQPVRRCGENSSENLQLLCATHNRQKYREGS